MVLVSGWPGVPRWLLLGVQLLQQLSAACLVQMAASLAALAEPLLQCSSLLAQQAWAWRVR